MAEGKTPKLTISASESRSLPMPENDCSTREANPSKKSKIAARKNSVSSKDEVILESENDPYTAAKQVCAGNSIRDMFLYAFLHFGMKIAKF